MGSLVQPLVKTAQERTDADARATVQAEAAKKVNVESTARGTAELASKVEEERQAEAQ